MWKLLLATGIAAHGIVPAARCLAADAHARHVFFDNSAAGGSYYHSAADVTAPSELAIVDGKLPVASEPAASAPNCLQIAWTSAFGGDWHARINAATRYGQRFELHGDTLVLSCYSPDGLTPEQAPLLGCMSPGAGVPSISLLKHHGPLPAGEWTDVAIPFEQFTGLIRGTRDSTFDPEKLSTLQLMQGLDDGRPHVLYIDDIRVVQREQLEDDAPPPPPQELTIEAGERHVDLAWAPVADADVTSYRIYRATGPVADSLQESADRLAEKVDNVTGAESDRFVPVATRPAHFTRAVDFPGPPGTTAAYKVTAVDIAGNESPLSTAVAATTRAMTDDELLTMIQRGCFRYYWDAGHRNAGMAIEILPGEGDRVALGGSGFGVMALVVGAERGFRPREEIAARVLQIVRFLKSADRFHGAWPHFFDGSTGKVDPFFGPYDNGGDLVETAFMVQGLLAARQYFDRDTPAEREIRATVTQLWREVEWDWYRRTPDSPVLWWHWSPDAAWHINHPLIGWNETMIVYLLAIASPTHGVPAEMYYSGYAGQSDMHVAYRHEVSRTTRGDHYANGGTYYGITLDVGPGNGGELFFEQFSFLGFDPRGKRDRYTNYFQNNRNIARIAHAYAIDNPRERKGYGADCWGRSAGVNSGGGRSIPRDDNGTICPSAALGMMPYTPDESLAAARHFYRDLGPKIWGAYGFHDGFNETDNWFDEVYMGLNQAQIVVGIENYRTGLVWKCFMANPEIQPMLDAIGFEPDPASTPPATAAAR
ncbi:MAG: hypothetical protein CMJ58_25960 [Planctomycetaceae bacterium]|nr:hypothetical protein [Planctomycetaceae bacterium]